ncbi:MAG: DUF1566 domain-containing protein [Candidatus Saccharibacteria bacterium]|nr:DUF1566 domain-containing protein [Candidatus Saccharibacteria bacterium]
MREPISVHYEKRIKSFIYPILIKKFILVLSLSFFLPFATAHANLEGTVDNANCDYINGWAWDNANPTSRVKLKVYDATPTESTLLTTLTAQTLRPDLLNAGQGDGKYGFYFNLPVRIRDAATHTLSVQFDGTTTELNNSPKTTTLACYGKLNDTGITLCSNESNRLSCPAINYVGQDGDYGRDKLAYTNNLPKIGTGSAGFDFTKIANDGSTLPATALLGTRAKDWACTLDNLTGLLWEIKTSDGGLRDQNNTYSWYHPDGSSNGGFAGYQNLGNCTGGISCDTYSYVNAVRTLQLCGKTAWRLPSKQELMSFIDFSRSSPPLDVNFFPDVHGDYHPFWWSSTPYSFFPSVPNDKAFVVIFFDLGFSNPALKESSQFVRLVRGPW